MDNARQERRYWGGSVNVTTDANQRGPDNPDGLDTRNGSLAIKTTSGLTKEVSIFQMAPFIEATFSNVLTSTITGNSYTIQVFINYTKEDNTNFSTTMFRSSTETLVLGIPPGKGPVTFTAYALGNYETTSKTNRIYLESYCDQIGLSASNSGLISSNEGNVKISGGDASLFGTGVYFNTHVIAQDA